MMDWLTGTWAVFEKELRLELRNRFGFNLLFMFVAAAVFVILYAIGRAPAEPGLLAALLWIVVIFAAAVGLARSFLAEEERGTVLFLRLHTEGTQVYAGKLLFNVVLLLAANVLAVAAFMLLAGLPIRLPGLLAVTILLGVIGLSGATTLLSAIISRSERGAALLPILLFPLLIPLLVALVSATKIAILDGAEWRAASNDIVTLVAFAGVVITAATLLFDYVWRD